MPAEQVEFAHRLIDEGVNVVHGHSSHHVKGIEVYRGRLILYGCGDLVNDYEGIGGYEEYRTELRLAYVARFGGAELTAVRMIPLRVRRMRLEAASAAEARWLCGLMAREGKRFGTRAEVDGEEELSLLWG